MKNLDLIIADDSELVLDGLENALQKYKQVTAIRRARNGQQVLDLFAERPANFVITDIEMEPVSGIELIKKLRPHYPDLWVATITDYYDIHHIKPLLLQNVHVIMDKTHAKRDIHKALKALQKGEPFYSVFVQKTIKNIYKGKRKAQREGAVPELTTKEKELLHLFAEGYSNNEIARKVSKSPYTIDTHRSNLYSKFNVNNPAKLASKARELGFLD